ncbi:uncharacterized protein ACWYII_014461 [Salvelinus alpinus]|uniref:uncharacterized protein n=1 Tax=Salvelinus alpinus TaxID=8036 RepID=UPI0039FBE742
MHTHTHTHMVNSFFSYEVFSLLQLVMPPGKIGVILSGESTNCISFHMIDVVLSVLCVCLCSCPLCVPCCHYHCHPPPFSLSPSLYFSFFFSLSYLPIPPLLLPSLLSCSLCSFLCPSLSHPHPDQWSSMRMDFKYLKEYLDWLYYQYLLITGIYVLEPWEQSIFNSVLFSSMAMVIYTSYAFVPVHVCLAHKFFSGICGEQPESTMPLIN